MTRVFTLSPAAAHFLYRNGGVTAVTGPRDICIGRVTSHYQHYQHPSALLPLAGRWSRVCWIWTGRKVETCKKSEFWSAAGSEVAICGVWSVVASQFITPPILLSNFGWSSQDNFKENNILSKERLSQSLKVGVSLKLYRHLNIYYTCFLFLSTRNNFIFSVLILQYLVVLKLEIYINMHQWNWSKLTILFSFIDDGNSNLYSCQGFLFKMLMQTKWLTWFIYI